MLNQPNINKPAAAVVRCTRVAYLVIFTVSNLIQERVLLGPSPEAFRKTADT